MFVFFHFGIYWILFHSIYSSILYWIRCDYGLIYCVMTIYHLLLSWVQCVNIMSYVYFVKHFAGIKVIVATRNSPLSHFSTKKTTTIVFHMCNLKEGLLTQHQINTNNHPNKDSRRTQTRVSFNDHLSCKEYNTMTGLEGIRTLITRYG